MTVALPDTRPTTACAAHQCRRAPTATGTCDDHAPPVTTGDFVGVTYRQIDYWTRVGYLRPSEATPGSGIAREWPDAEVAVAALIRRLTLAGLDLRTAARVAREQAESLTGHARLRGGIRLDLDAA